MILYKLSLNVTAGSGESGVERVTVSQKTLELRPGDTRTLYAQLSPAPGDLAACDADWELVEDKSDPDVVTVAPDEFSWLDMWDIEENRAAGISAADAGALARSKLVVTANKPGTATVKARLTPLPASGEAPEGFCVVTVSAPRAGGGGGCGAGFFGAGAGAFAAMFFTIYRRKIYRRK
jgi:hypothetical protein